MKFHHNHGRDERDAYLNFVYNLFYSNHGYKKYMQTYHGLFSQDPKQFMEQYFNVKLPSL